MQNLLHLAFTGTDRHSGRQQTADCKQFIIELIRTRLQLMILCKQERSVKTGLKRFCPNIDVTLANGGGFLWRDDSVEVYWQLCSETV